MRLLMAIDQEGGRVASLPDCFFFSSRRRHTRFDCDWSSDVCSSDLFTGFPRPRSVVANGGVYLWKDGRKNWDTATIVFEYGPLDDPTKGFQVVYASRSEERRVGKEGRSRWAPYH